jgi:hypothetical protein
MIISHKHKFIFFKTRKTAGSSIQVALAEHCGPEDIITGQYQLGVDDNSHSAGLNLDKFFTNHPHPELSDVKNFLGNDIWNTYFKFAFIRNPYDIAVSRYHWDIKGKLGIESTSIENFREWVNDGLFEKDRASIYTCLDNNVELDFIGFYENLEDDISYICNKIKIPKLNLPKLKSGYRNNSSYADFYNEETKKKVYDFFLQDFKIFGYNFENKNVVRRQSIITSEIDFPENDNINNPCIIQVPEWVKDPLGKYYLYFSNHEGTTIKMGYSNDINGPWHILNDVLNLKNTPCDTHIASPYVVIDNDKKLFNMYYHGDINNTQGTLMAISETGINFINQSKDILCKFYLTLFNYKGITYGIAKDGNNGSVLYNVTNNFIPIFNLLPKSRHCSAIVKNDKLYIVYSLMGDTPEHIRLCTIQLHDDIDLWDTINDEALIIPLFKHEGINLPKVKSVPGSATRAFNRPIQELRDPFIFECSDKLYIFYVTKGEREISYAILINYFNEN